MNDIQSRVQITTFDYDWNKKKQFEKKKKEKWKLQRGAKSAKLSEKNFEGKIYTNFNIP